MKSLATKLVVAISSRALFDLAQSHAIFEQEGERAYAQYQVEHENTVLDAGCGYALVQKLLGIRCPLTDEPLVEVILLSRNSVDTGLRIFNSIAHHELNITRAVFTRGESPYPYIHAFNADLFLSADRHDVKQALNAGCAAATLLSSATHNASAQLRIAFDGDCVLFSDEAERIYQTHGLQAFSDHEVEKRHSPLGDGPLKRFLYALHRIQALFPLDNSPIRTALVTARAAPAHERVIQTFRAWNIRIDDALFLGGLDKSAFLQAFGADIFFDDQVSHCERARAVVATAHVPHGIVNPD